MSILRYIAAHEATALSVDLEKLEETHRAVEVVKLGLLTHRKYSYTRELHF
jgi:hypothetical protein